jgi:uncharacterized protein (DUF2062 family)
MKKIINKSKALFKQGLTPKQLCKSVIVSGLISTIPILGLSTFMITTVSLKWKLNLPLMLAISYLMWPIQILMIIPFMKIGQFIFSVPGKHHSVEEIISSFQESFFKTVTNLSFELLCGFGGWLLTAVPVAIGIYYLTLLFFKVTSNKTS